MQEENANYANFGTAGQAATGGYGGPRTTFTSNIPVRPAKTKTAPNWGGIIKGVAIVTAVVVAAWVGAAAFTAASGYLAAEMATSGSTVGAIASSVAEAGSWIIGGIKAVTDYLVATVSNLPAQFVSYFGLTSNPAMAASLTASSGGISTVGALAGAAIAAPVAIPALKSIALTTTAIDPTGPAGFDGGLPGGTPGGSPGSPPTIDPSSPSSGILSSMNPGGTAASHANAGSHMLHDLAHHSAEHATDHRSGWMDRFKPTSNYANHADAVANRKPAGITPRDGNFVAELEAARKRLADAPPGTDPSSSGRA